MLNNCYLSIPNIYYKLLSDKPFQIILTNDYQTLLSTTIWELIPSDCYTNFHQRTLETTLTNLLLNNHFNQYISTKSFQTSYYKLLPEKPLLLILIIRKRFQIICIYIYIYDKDIYVNTTTFLAIFQHYKHETVHQYPKSATLKIATVATVLNPWVWKNFLIKVLLINKSQLERKRKQNMKR